MTPIHAIAADVDPEEPYCRRHAEAENDDGIQKNEDQNDFTEPLDETEEAEAFTSDCNQQEDKHNEKNKNNTKEDGDSDDFASLFHWHGYLQFPNLLSVATCQRLRRFILDELNNVIMADPQTQEKRLSNIHERNQRWDLKLPHSPLVHQAMQEILLQQPCSSSSPSSKQQEEQNGSNDSTKTNSFLESVLAAILLQEHDHDEEDSSDLVLAELGSLISKPGAKHQEWHADTIHTGPDEPDCICCFIALQTTPLSMGPTQFLPDTHLADFHKTAVVNFPPRGLMPAYVQPKSMQSAFTDAGQAFLMDCRLYHRGSANTHKTKSRNDNTEDDNIKEDDDNNDDDEGTRVLFYFTVRSRNTKPPGGFLFTILPELKNKPLVEFLKEYTIT